MQYNFLGSEQEAENKAIKGLQLISDFVTVEEEKALLDVIDDQPWLTDLKRRVQHYGWKYDYTARTVSPESYIGTLPEWVVSYAERLCDAGCFSQMPDQVIVNEYQSGQGISAHIDCVPCFGEVIASLSLESGCSMDFTHHKTGSKQSIWLEPRSLLALSGPARYQWKHSIASRKSDILSSQRIARGRRVSLTFRTVIR